MKQKNYDKQEYKLDLYENNTQEVQIENINHPTKPTIVKFATMQENFCQSPCKKFGECGGCDLLCLNYKTQLELKQKFIENLFSYSLNGVKVENIEGLYYPFKYRNKILFSAGVVKGATELGFYEEKSKKIVPISDCLMHDEWSRVLLAELKNFIKHSKIRAFNPDTLTGSLRYVVARNINNNLMVTLVVTDPMVMGLKHLYDALKEKFNEVSIYLNINTTQTSAVLSPKFIHKMGEKQISGTMNGVKFKLSPKSFYQVNTLIASKIYNQAVKLVNAKNGTYVIDAFSGIGITSMLFAKSCQNVISVEIEKSAVDDARELAKLNKIDNIQFVCEDATTAIPRIAEQTLGKSVSLFVDPPRAGISEEFAETIIKAKIKNIVYLSCNPLTLLRDCKIFMKSGYKITFIKPYDMFPHTKHVETLVKLEKV